MEWAGEVVSAKPKQVDIFVKETWQAGIQLQQKNIDLAYKLMEILQTDEVEGSDEAAYIREEIEELHDRII